MELSIILFKKAPEMPWKSNISGFVLGLTLGPRPSLNKETETLHRFQKKTPPQTGSSAILCSNQPSTWLNSFFSSNMALPRWLTPFFSW